MIEGHLSRFGGPVDIAAIKQRDQAQFSRKKINDICEQAEYKKRTQQNIIFVCSDNKPKWNVWFHGNLAKTTKKTLEYTLALKTTKNKLLPLKRLSHEAYRFASASTINIKPLPQEAS